MLSTTIDTVVLMSSYWELADLWKLNWEEGHRIIQCFPKYFEQMMWLGNRTCILQLWLLSQNCLTCCMVSRSSFVTFGKAIIYGTRVKLLIPFSEIPKYYNFLYKLLNKGKRLLLSQRFLKDLTEKVKPLVCVCNFSGQQEKTLTLIAIIASGDCLLFIFLFFFKF